MTSCTRALASRGRGSYLQPARAAHSPTTPARARIATTQER